MGCLQDLLFIFESHQFIHVFMVCSLEGEVLSCMGFLSPVIGDLMSFILFGKLFTSISSDIYSIPISFPSRIQLYICHLIISHHLNALFWFFLLFPFCLLTVPTLMYWLYNSIIAELQYNFYWSIFKFMFLSLVVSNQMRTSRTFLFTCFHSWHFHLTFSYALFAKMPHLFMHFFHIVHYSF